jgi:hypothetical protein
MSFAKFQFRHPLARHQMLILATDQTQIPGELILSIEGVQEIGKTGFGMFDGCQLPVGLEVQLRAMNVSKTCTQN